MSWIIEYTEAALRQLRKLDRQVARRILDTMEERIAHADNPRYYCVYSADRYPFNSVSHCYLQLHLTPQYHSCFYSL